MTIQAPPGSVKAYCNLVALENGLDPGGHATPFDSLILLEKPLPWPGDIYGAAGFLPQAVLDIYARQLQRYQATGTWPPDYLFLIAPDKHYSQPDLQRVIYFWKDEGLAAAFTRREYMVPTDQAGPLIWALTEDPRSLPGFDPWRVPGADSFRDLLVCTHGTVDVACAKFGFPLYRYLRQAQATDHVRIWRVSHFGGHVFAPTLFEMPSGHNWAYVEEEQAGQIVRRSGSVADLRPHYRGWSGLPNGFLQAAEREMLMREGWQWLAYPKQGTTVAQDSVAEPTWAEVCIQFDDPSGRHAYRARVEVERKIDMIHTTGYEGTYPHPQYHVAWLERTTETG